MRVNDVLYGEFDLPGYVSDLCGTPLMKRSKRIAQDMLPKSCQPWSAPTRFDHQLGVWHLASIVADKNELALRDRLMLEVAALLHDTGNSPFTHLSEPFLTHLTGMNGETHLRRLLHGSEAESIMRSLGLSPDWVVECVAGRLPPLSTILHGSMDVDNLDNVARYWHAKTGKGIGSVMEMIARCFDFRPEGWSLEADAFSLSQFWRMYRKLVYGAVYEVEHLVRVAMLGRAMDFAFRRDQLRPDFFELNDEEALDFLASANSKSAYLVGRLQRHQPFACVVERAYLEPFQLHKNLASDWRTRYKLADLVAEERGIPPEMVCAFFDVGKDDRQVALPFVRKDGSTFRDIYPERSPFRIQVYVAEDVGQTGLDFSVFNGLAQMRPTT